TISARIVVGADGRASQVRRWAGFEVNRNPDLLTIAGTVFTGCDVHDHAVHLTFGPGIASLVAPLGAKRARAYFIYPRPAGRRRRRRGATRPGVSPAEGGPDRIPGFPRNGAVRAARRKRPAAHSGSCLTSGSPERRRDHHSPDGLVWGSGRSLPARGLPIGRI